MFENRRIDRVNALVQRELSDIIQRSLKDPRVKFCTITQVEVSSDLKYADIKVSVVGDKKQKRSTMAGLKRAAGFLRREVGRRIDLRYAPELRFQLDHSVDHLMKIDRLLKQVRVEEEKHDISSEVNDEATETI
jgi:ribosome-binding factor A